jgi:hypothetical protein
VKFSGCEVLIWLDGHGGPSHRTVPNLSTLREHPEAQEQADECDAWWREHRTATRELFARELAGIKALLLNAPNIGSMYTVLDGLPVRRVLLPKTSTHVYYSIDADRNAAFAQYIGSNIRSSGRARRSSLAPVTSSPALSISAPSAKPSASTHRTAPGVPSPPPTTVHPR